MADRDPVAAQAAGQAEQAEAAQAPPSVEASPPAVADPVAAQAEQAAAEQAFHAVADRDSVAAQAAEQAFHAWIAQAEPEAATSTEAAIRMTAAVHAVADGRRRRRRRRRLPRRSRKASEAASEASGLSLRRRRRPLRALRWMRLRLRPHETRRPLRRVRLQGLAQRRRLGACMGTSRQRIRFGIRRLSRRTKRLEPKAQQQQRGSALARLVLPGPRHKQHYGNTM